MRLILLFFSLWLSSLIVAAALCADRADAPGFGEQLRIGEQLKYEHWNTKKKTTTGYTIVHYKPFLKDGKEFILETNQNTDKNGKVFSDKKTWFFRKTGEFSRYEETDYRTQTSISDQIMGKNIVTEIMNDSGIRRFTIEMESDLVPFEILTLMLQKKIPLIREKKRFEFSLYLPALTFELEKKHLPLSFSKLRMIARLEKHLQVDSVFGRKPAVSILVKPDSFLITSLLPRNKTEFRFTFLAEPPHYLIEFEENVTKNTLMEIRRPQ
ncbi:MAG: hypothetical protein GY866_02255 [Proteobacteria bacterium]|nr:hypothetical protein [Pseudomonadota bacterium]